MKKWISMLLSALLLLTLFGCTGQQTESEPDNASSTISSEVTSTTARKNRKLVIYTWQSMFPQTVLDAFTEKTGITVKYQEFSRESSMVTTLTSGREYQYDLIVANDSSMEEIIAAGQALKLDRKELPSFENINELYQGLYFDPDDEYTVPYGAAVQTIVYNPASVGEITSWEDLWSAIVQNKLGLLPDWQVGMGMALKTVGAGYNTTDTTKIDKAIEKLDSLVPNVNCFSDMDLPQKMADGELGAAVMYPSQAVMTVLTNENLKLAFPKEGTGFGVQEMFIPAQAEHVEEAYEFINYILQPEVAAECFEYLGFCSTNSAADHYLSKEYQDILSLPQNYIELEHLQTDETVQEQLQAAWNEFRSKCEA